MSFLMGLNDFFSQVRGQLLLMEPLLPINKVFSLVSQEEHQRIVGSQCVLVHSVLLVEIQPTIWPLQ